jgi:mono/diheme cytochrome c family protein
MRRAPLLAPLVALLACDAMHDQAAIQPQEGPPVATPEGVVPFGGRERLPEEEELDGLTNPAPTGKLAMVDGRRLYNIHCSPCHGEKGKGDGPVAKHLSETPSDLTDPELQGELSDGAMVHVLNHGTLSEVMPGFADDIRPMERWLLVRYVRTLLVR